MQITTQPSEKIIRVLITGEIDEKGAEKMKNKFIEIGAGSFKEVIIDFSGVTHIGSAGLGKLLLFYKTMASDGGKIAIEKISPEIFKLMQQLKLDTVFNLSSA